MDVVGPTFFSVNVKKNKNVKEMASAKYEDNVHVNKVQHAKVLVLEKAIAANDHAQVKNSLQEERDPETRSNLVFFAMRAIIKHCNISMMHTVFKLVGPDMWRHADFLDGNSVHGLMADMKLNGNTTPTQRHAMIKAAIECKINIPEHCARGNLSYYPIPVMDLLMEHGATASFFEVYIIGCETDLIQHLIDKGADVNLGWSPTPLMQASGGCRVAPNLEQMRMLLKNGADPNHRRLRGYSRSWLCNTTILERIAENYHWFREEIPFKKLRPAVELLIENGAMIHTDDVGFYKLLLGEEFALPIRRETESKKRPRAPSKSAGESYPFAIKDGVCFHATNVAGEYEWTPLT